MESSQPDPTWILTRYNIREIVPGALTPLSRDVILRGINAGFHQMSLQVGVPKERLRGMAMSVCYHGHVFYNMSAQYIISEYVLGTRALGKAMQQLAATIRATDESGAFQKLALMDANRWLRTGAPHVQLALTALRNWSSATLRRKSSAAETPRGLSRRETGITAI